MLEENKKLISEKNYKRVVPEFVAVTLLLILWGVTLWAYFNLPQTIPVHFNFKGNTDRFGSKGNLFILAIIPTIIYIVLTLLPRNWSHFNFPDKKTKENTADQIVLAGDVFMYLKIIILDRKSVV